MGKCWIGIDPGANGALAVVHKTGAVDIFDLTDDERGLHSMLERINSYVVPELVVIEQQQAFPGQGVASSFKLGCHYGKLLGLIAAMRWPLQTVRPAEWKKGMGYPAGKDKKALKAHSMLTARRLYPIAEPLLARVKDHDRAEALLLAHYAKRGDNQ